LTPGVTVKVRVDDCELPSVTRSVNVDVDVDVGMPEMVPVEARASPAGSEPDTIDQVLVPLPPAEVRICEYDWPTTVDGSDAVVITGAELVATERL